MRVAVLGTGRLLSWHADVCSVLQERPDVGLVGLAMLDADHPPQSAAWRLMLRTTRKAGLGLCVPEDEIAATVERCQSASDLTSWLKLHQPDLVVVPEVTSGLATLLNECGIGRIWSFRFGSGEPAGWREVAEGSSTSTIDLVALEGGEARTIRSATVRVQRESYDVTVRRFWWAAASLLPGALTELANGSVGRQAVPSRPHEPRTIPPSEVAIVSVVMLARWVRKQIRVRVRHMQWNVGVVDRPLSTFIDDPDVDAVDWLPTPPRSRFVADPFGLWIDGELVVYVEEVDYRTSVGHISEARPGDRRSAARPEAVYERPGTHLSYPYAFRDGDDLYMVPESKAGGDVRLVRRTDSAGWSDVAVLLDDVRVGDATVFRHGGRWWIAGTEDFDSSLSLWHAAALEGPWEPHAGNPVKIDVRSSRPAGTPFVHDGHLYRPAQDCSERYGGSVALCRIDVLSPTEFREVVVSRVDPPRSGRFRRGIHTLAAAGNVTLIDASRDIFAPQEFARQVERARRRVWRRFSGSD